MSFSAYACLMLAGIAVSLVLWGRLVGRDRRLFWVYLAALGGGFVGAKAVYFVAEGWLHLGSPDFWLDLATGKSILGALLGGYAAVELCKRLVGYTGQTGDWFALVVPIGVTFGRLGCWLHGCCQGIEWQGSWFTLTDASGIARWPAVPVEMLFNLTAFFVIVLLRQAHWLAGQQFHLYLIGYGGFRFLHEFVRDEPRLTCGLTGYQFAAVVVLVFGMVAFFRRARNCEEVHCQGAKAGLP